MCKYLPYVNLKLINSEQTSKKIFTYDKFCLNSIGKNSSDGYILEDHLEYPGELHELHDNYSLASEKLEIIHNMLSNYCGSIKNKWHKNWWC